MPHQGSKHAVGQPDRKYRLTALRVVSPAMAKPPELLLETVYRQLTSLVTTGGKTQHRNNAEFFKVP